MIISPWIKLLRPVQWLKNLMLLFPPFLGGALFQRGLLEKGIFPIAAFCLASSAIYVFNDLLDADKDALHPGKRSRPIPSGQVRKSSAAILALLLLASAIVIGFQAPRGVLFFLLIYIAVAVLYSVNLKEIPIVDLFCISAGFLCRLQAGGEAFGVVISDWLFLCVFLLSVFLSTGKRLCEKNTLGDNAGNHRKSLTLYPDGFLDGALYMTGGAVLVTYTIYVVQRPSLVYTVPLCTFGLMRYILRVKAGQGGDPTESLLQDMPLLAVGLVWAIMIGIGIY